MSAAVLIVVIIVAVLVVGFALLYLCKRWRRPRDRSKYLSWDDARGSGALLQHQDSVVSVTPPDPNMNTFITYRNTYHNFELQYPDTWHCKESSTPQESLVAHFSCPDTEPTFKRLSVAWDDLCWTSISPKQFAEHVMRHLPTAVRGSQVVSDRPVRLGDSQLGHEIVYVITDEDGSLIKLLNVATIAHTKAFTLTFSIAEAEYDTYLPLANHLINSFRLLDTGPVARVPETPTDPDKVQWREVLASQLHVAVQFPTSWTRDAVGNANVLRFTCPRAERYFKSINFFIIDLSSIESESLLEDLVQFYKEEVDKQGSVRIVDQRHIKGLQGRPAYLFKSVGRRGLIDITSCAFVGLHGAAGTSGHIITFTASTEVYPRYEVLARAMFESLRVLEDE